MAAGVTWTQATQMELDCAASFIARDSQHYANELVKEARLTALSLRRFPRRGRIVPELANPAVRELFVGRYRLVYEIKEDSVRVVAFLHGARQFPDEIR